MKHGKGTRKELNVDDEEVLSEGEYEHVSRSIFLNPTQSSMLPQSDLFPEASAPQVNPLAKESKKKRPVMQLVDLEAKDSDGDQSEASGSDGTEEEDDPSTRRATPNKKQMRDQQDELGTYSSFLSSFLVFGCGLFFRDFLPDLDIFFEFRPPIFQDVFLQPDNFFFERES